MENEQEMKEVAPIPYTWDLVKLTSQLIALEGFSADEATLEDYRKNIEGGLTYRAEEIATFLEMLKGKKLALGALINKLRERRRKRELASAKSDFRRALSSQFGDKS